MLSATRCSQGCCFNSYPFLTTSLPSEIFTSAIFFGLFGALVGIFYAKTVLKLKGLVHDFFHAPHDGHLEKTDPVKEEVSPAAEETPLISKGATENGDGTKSKTPAEPALPQKIAKRFQKYICCVIPYEPHRALAAGIVAGAMAGGIGMFFPQVCLCPCELPSFRKVAVCLMFCCFTFAKVMFWGGE